MKMFHINKINKYIEKQNEEMEKASGNTSSDSKIHRPNVKPSSTYNF